MEPMETLSIFQAGLHLSPCACGSRRHEVGAVAETTGGSDPSILLPTLEGCRNQTHPTEQQLLAVQPELQQVEPLTKEQRIVVRTSLPVRGGLQTSGVSWATRRVCPMVVNVTNLSLLKARWALSVSHWD